MTVLLPQLYTYSCIFMEPHFLIINRIRRNKSILNARDNLREDFIYLHRNVITTSEIGGYTRENFLPGENSEVL
jgi:hypothetical protein